LTTFPYHYASFEQIQYSVQVCGLV